MLSEERHGRRFPLWTPVSLKIAPLETHQLFLINTTVITLSATGRLGNTLPAVKAAYGIPDAGHRWGELFASWMVAAVRNKCSCTHARSVSVGVVLIVWIDYRRVIERVATSNCPVRLRSQPGSMPVLFSSVNVATYG